MAWYLIPQTPTAENPAAMGGDDDTSQLWIDTCGGETEYFWVDPESSDAPSVTPEDLAWAAYVRLERDLPDPVLAADPPPGEAAVIHTPTFVEVSNWLDEFTEEECDGGVCVSVTATPELSFAPGEPGASSVSCAGSGTRYIPGDESPEAQAAEPGSCTHTYTARTGVDGRPEEWPGETTVTWEISWTSSSGSGTLPSIARSADLPRPVDEVQAVVTEQVAER